jgi:hypothetical protein
VKPHEIKPLGKYHGSKMTPNQSIEIQLVDREGKPFLLGKVKIEINFFTHGNFRYAFGAGFTDEMGHMTVTYFELEAQRRKSSEYNVMDYNTKLDDCDPKLELVVLSDEELRQRNNKAERYFDAPLPWAKDWPSNIRVGAQKIRVMLREEVTRVDIPVQSMREENQKPGNLT